MMLHLEKIWSCCDQLWKIPKKHWKMGSKWDFSGSHNHTIGSFETIVIPSSNFDFLQHKMAHIMCFEICLVAL